MVVGLVTRTLIIVTCTMIPGSFPVTTSFPSSSSPSFYNRSSWWSHRKATKHCKCKNSSQNRQAHRLKTRLSKKTRIEPTCTINLPNQERDQRVQVRDQIRAVAEAAAAQAVQNALQAAAAQAAANAVNINMAEPPAVIHPMLTSKSKLDQERNNVTIFLKKASLAPNTWASRKHDSGDIGLSQAIFGRFRQLERLNHRLPYMSQAQSAQNKAFPAESGSFSGRVRLCLT